MTTQAVVADSISVVAAEHLPPGRSLWKDAYSRLKKDRIAMGCLFIVLFYALIALFAKVGWIATPWDRVVGAPYLPPSLSSLELLLGTDIFGRSVFYKVLQGTLNRHECRNGLFDDQYSNWSFSRRCGRLFRGVVDDLVVWFYTTLSSIPHIMLLIAIAYVMEKGLTAIYVALGVTAWVSLARVIRGEFIKHKTRDYVVAAESLGARHSSRIFKHILPNVSHFIIINLSIQFMSAIKSEVILSFLGPGRTRSNRAGE